MGAFSEEEMRAAAADAAAHEASKATQRGASAAKKEPAPVAPTDEPEETPAETETEEPAAATAETEPEEKPEDENRPVYNKQWVKLKKERREFEAYKRQERDRLTAELTAKQQGLESLEAAKRAVQVGDYDSLAKAMGFKDWNDANKRYLEDSTAPGYKRLRELEENEARRRQEIAKENEARRAAELTASERRQRETNMSVLSQDMKGMGGLASEFAADAFTVGLVFDEIKKEFEGQESVSHEEIAAVVPDIVERVLERNAEAYAEWKDRFDRHPEDAILQKVLGRRQTKNADGRAGSDNPESRSPQRVNRGKPKPSHSRTSDASHARDLSEAEARRQFVEAAKRNAS